MVKISPWMCFETTFGGTSRARRQLRPRFSSSSVKRDSIEKKKKSKKVFFLQKQENGKKILPSLQDKQHYLYTFQETDLYIRVLV